MILPFLIVTLPYLQSIGYTFHSWTYYCRVCDLYTDFPCSARILSNKLLKQGYVQHLLMSSLHTFYGHHHSLIDRYVVSISQMRQDYPPNLTLTSFGVAASLTILYRSKWKELGDMIHNGIFSNTVINHTSIM